MDTHHINPRFDSAIDGIDTLLAAMEEAVREQLVLVEEAFRNMDAVQAKVVRQKDAELNELSKQVEEKVVLALARHQPVAGDLRHMVGALKMAIELERAGDYIKHLAKNVVRLTGYRDEINISDYLQKLLDEVQKMFDNFCAARRADDVDAAVRVWVFDQTIDDLCSDAVRHAFENQNKGIGGAQGLVNQISIAKNLERIGDKIKNLVEIYYYQIKGDELDISLD